jgi:hypothetical protein
MTVTVYFLVILGIASPEWSTAYQFDRDYCLKRAETFTANGFGAKCVEVTFDVADQVQPEMPN